MANPTTETFTPDNLLYGDFPITSKGVTIATGQATLARGSVMAKATGDSKWYLVDTANADAGRKIAKGVLLAEVDTAAADIEGVIAESGKFAEDHLVFGGTDTIDTHRDAMRDISLFTDKSAPAV